jgi:hypothetical protein
MRADEAARVTESRLEPLDGLRAGLVKFDPFEERVHQVALRLWHYCQERQWAGADPYDALNSRVFRALPFLDFAWARLALTQLVKRSPVDLRPWLRVPRTQNPKGLALFLASLLKMERAGLPPPGCAGEPARLAQRLLELRSPGVTSWCWGYNFSWQTRFTLVPAGSPNIICTTFVANALLDWHERTGESRYLEIAASACQFILEVLFWESGDGLGCFSYTPLWKSEVHNASLLGAALLCRVARLTGEAKFQEPALRAARRAVKMQHADGAWDYGESDQPSQRWKDNFHTGYNLCGLRTIGAQARTPEFEPAVRRGFDYYLANFFETNGAPKYFHDRLYPIDVHSVAQSVITLLTFSDFHPDNRVLARRVLQWGLENLWDEKRGYFYCQKQRHFTVRIPYMRWAQAWMVWTFANFLEHAAAGPAAGASDK